VLSGLAAVAALAMAASPAAGANVSDADLANDCFAARSAATGKFVAIAGDGYRADSGEVGAARFYLKPSGLGTYLPQDQGGKLLAARAADAIGRDDVAGPATEWALPRIGQGYFAIRSTQTGRRGAVASSGALVQSGGTGRDTLFTLVRESGCQPFPEAEVNATGRPFKGTNADGTVDGFVDMHLHITANQRAGGSVIYGEPFDRFGIAAALGHDEAVHGPDGIFDVTGNLLRTGLPAGTHDTNGWPSFTGWPVFDTNTHQQTYYVWLKRAWLAGERMVVAQTVEDQPLCEIEVLGSHDCDETRSVERQVQRLRDLQDYVDAQSGGASRGWFQLVYDPAQARHVIESGKLAVLIGVESSDLFGCSELWDQPQCTRADIDAGIAHFKELGVRSVFPMHWIDNAFGGAAVEGGDKGTFINAMEGFQTGHFFRTGPCPEEGQGEDMGPFSLPDLQALQSAYPALQALSPLGLPVYPPGPQCNVKGLTDLGEYLIRRLMDEHILIEMDHMSEWARLRVLEMAEERNYPLISSHTNTGGLWTRSDLQRLYALGGLAAARPDQAPGLASRLTELSSSQGPVFFCAVGIGTDTGGFSSQPAPRDDAAQSPLTYPFHSYRGDAQFDRQRSGERTYDLNKDGLAHYGLWPDLLADVQQHGGAAALSPLFHSAEAYLEMWQKVFPQR
jgi:Membrane dipeptidase (Peptidase family M19)